MTEFFLIKYKEEYQVRTLGTFNRFVRFTRPENISDEDYLEDSKVKFDNYLKEQLLNEYSPNNDVKIIKRKIIF